LLELKLVTELGVLSIGDLVAAEEILCFAAAMSQAPGL
jgi:hypothetical protein